MDNPNVASAGSSLDFLQGVSGYQLSNSNGVGSVTHVIGQQSTVASQPPMASPSLTVPFEKLQPKAMSTAPGPMGTDYKS